LESRQRLGLQVLRKAAVVLLIIRAIRLTMLKVNAVPADLLAQQPLLRLESRQDVVHAPLPPPVGGMKRRVEDLN